VRAAGRTLNVTTSIGVTTLGTHDTTHAQILERADVALYQAKSAGRNQVVFAAGAA
jgi:two-component system cell cycle response regulator